LAGLRLKSSRPSLRQAPIECLVIMWNSLLIPSHSSAVFGTHCCWNSIWVSRLFHDVHLFIISTVTRFWSMLWPSTVPPLICWSRRMFAYQHFLHDFDWLIIFIIFSVLCDIHTNLILEQEIPLCMDFSWWRWLAVTSRWALRILSAPSSAAIVLHAVHSFFECMLLIH
jgi:hypothetical protein